MSAVSDWIVREYFEALGFVVQQPRKYQVVARSKRPDEEMDLVAFNPRPLSGRPSEGLLWGTADVQRVTRALVAIRGWYTDRFSPSVLEISPDIFRIAEGDVVRQAERVLGGKPVTKILCVPGLPASAALQDRALGMLKEKGIDGVLSFRAMLLELAAKVDVNKSYDRSDLLQLLRILKNYGLLKDAQLELFARRGRRGGPRPRARKPSSPPAEESA